MVKLKIRLDMLLKINGKESGLDELLKTKGRDKKGVENASSSG